jgi:YVTN family beta-propeller protein
MITTGVAYGAAHEIAYDSVKGEIFTSSGTPNGEGETPTVTVISDSTNTVVTTIQVGNYPREAVYDSGMNEIFVANTGGTVSVISDSTNSVVATITVGGYPYGLADDSAKGEVFVFNENDGTVSVISDSTNAVVATVTGVAPSTINPISIAYDPSKGEIFVSDSVISDTSNTIVAHLPAGLGNTVYASGKGEIIGTSSTGLSVFSDSSSPTSTSTAAPSPTVPEFSNTMLFTISTAMIVVTICAIAIARRKSPSLSYNPK